MLNYIISPQRAPPATPISASFASPGPLTAQPITAIFTGFLISFTASSISFARDTKSISVLPQVGQEIKWTGASSIEATCLNWYLTQIIASLDHAEGFHIAPAGKVSTLWKRENESIILEIQVPEIMYGRIILPSGYIFDDGKTVRMLESGKYTITKQ